MAHLLRARSRPHPARRRLPPPGRQDPGVRLPRRSPAHPPHPRARGRPGRRRPSLGRSASTSRSPRPSRSATTAATAPAAMPARTRSARTSTAASTTPRGAPTSRWSRSTCAPRRSTASATTRGAARRPTTPEGEVVSWADRIAYVCHDFEDAVAAGIVTADMLPPLVRDRCGERRSRAARRVHRTAMIDAAASTGRIGMTARSPRRWPSSAASTTTTSTSARRRSAQARSRHRPAAGPRRALRRSAQPARPTSPAIDAGSPRGAARRGRLRRRDDRSLRLPPGRHPARLGA